VVSVLVEEYLHGEVPSQVGVAALEDHVWDERRWSLCSRIKETPPNVTGPCGFLSPGSRPDRGEEGADLRHLGLVGRGTRRDSPGTPPGDAHPTLRCDDVLRPHLPPKPP
jgi:hypothetical protein